MMAMATAPTALVQAVGLGVRLPDPVRQGWVPALDAVDLTVAAGRTTAVVGETGAGKSMLLAALMGLLPAGAQLRGSLWHNDSTGRTDLTRLTDRQWRQVRGRRVGWWSQQALFTPTRSIRSQLAEASPGAPVADVAARCGLPTALLDRRPVQLSGGELRRAAAVAALLHDPPLLLADEPTAGLGSTDVATVVAMLAQRRDREQTTIVVTHDLGFAAAVADSIAVMRSGRVVEHGTTGDVCTAPSDPYTRDLVAASRQDEEDR